METFIIVSVLLFFILLVVVLSSRARIIKTYKKYLTIGNHAGLNGLQIALIGKEKLELDWLQLAKTDRPLSECYNPKYKTLVLSNAVCDYTSLTALATTAHELGHAVQDRQNNRLFGLVNIFSRITHFTNAFIVPLFVIAIPIFGLVYYHVIAVMWFQVASALFMTGYILFLLHCVVKFTTIPLEYDASKKALNFLKDYRLIDKKEVHLVKKLLNIAATTYIASLFDGFVVFGQRVHHFFHKKS